MIGLCPITVAEWHVRPEELGAAIAYWVRPETAALKAVEDTFFLNSTYDIDFTDGTFRRVKGEETLYVSSEIYEALKCGK